MEQMRPLSIRAAGRQAGCLQMNSETLRYRWMIVPWFFRPEGPLLTMESGKPSGPPLRSRFVLKEFRRPRQLCNRQRQSRAGFCCEGSNMTGILAREDEVAFKDLFRVAVALNLRGKSKPK